MSADDLTAHRTSRRNRRPEDRSTSTMREKLDWAYSVPLSAGRGVSLGVLRHVLGALAWRWSDSFGASCYPSIETIAELLGMSPDQVQRALLELDRQGVLVRQRRHRDRGRLGTYEYRLRLTRPHHAMRSEPLDHDRPDRTTRSGEDETRPQDATVQTAPRGQSRPHHAVAEQSRVINPPNRARPEITAENIAHRAGELIVDEKLRKGEDVRNLGRLVEFHARRLVTEKSSRLGRLVTYQDCTLDELARCLLDGSNPPPRPTPYEPPTIERCTPEQARAALDRARQATSGHDGADELDEHRPIDQAMPGETT